MIYVADDIKQKDTKQIRLNLQDFKLTNSRLNISGINTTIFFI